MSEFVPRRQGIHHLAGRRMQIIAELADGELRRLLAHVKCRVNGHVPEKVVAVDDDARAELFLACVQDARQRGA